MSRAHSAKIHFGHDRSEQQLASAKETADRALEIAPDLIDAHVALGFYYYWGRKDYDPALVAAARALDIQSDFIPALELKAWSLRRMGRLEEAVDIMLRIIELSPGSAVTMRDLAETYVFLRRYPEAVRYNELSVLAEPDQYTAYQQWARVLRLQGDVAGARARLEAMPKLPVTMFTRDGWYPQYLVERSGKDFLSMAANNPGEYYISQNSVVTNGEMRGLGYTFLGEPVRAREAYESALASMRARRPAVRRRRSVRALMLRAEAGRARTAGGGHR